MKPVCVLRVQSTEKVGELFNSFSFFPWISEICDSKCDYLFIYFPSNSGDFFPFKHKQFYLRIFRFPWSAAGG